MPPVEAGKVEIILGRDGSAVKGLVVGVLQLDVLESLVVGNEAVADDLDLGLMGNGLQVGMENAALGIERLAVAVRRGSGIEALREFELSLWGNAALVLENYDLVGVEGITDDFIVGI